LCAAPVVVIVVKSGRMRWTWQVARMREIQNFSLTPEGKRPHGIPRRRWEGNIRKDIREIEWRCEVDSSVSGWTVVNMVMNLRVPENAGNFS